MANGIAVIKRENGKVIIEIEQVDLLNCVNNHPEGYQIVDEEAFFNYLEKHLTELNEQEDGCTQFYRLFDDLVSDAYEGGEDFVKNPLWDDEDSEDEE